ncbi:unnamed protein product [Protopolystoma xenopodis]|uniref:Uncharacterized protein n=1 Tax=Protopolystoma xenopodis TaxID=117903 RepID=A0A448WE91_9PLAT|nr:unnamed protein product [Protopolystoma xenopodis]
MHVISRSRDNEYNLLQISKRFMSELEMQMADLQKADQFPDNAITEASQIRAQILSSYNTAMQYDERVEMLRYDAGLLREERKLLKRDYSKLPTAEVGLFQITTPSGCTKR